MLLRAYGPDWPDIDTYTSPNLVIYHCGYSRDGLQQNEALNFKHRNDSTFIR